jgi:hypothetical protein
MDFSEKIIWFVILMPFKWLLWPPLAKMKSLFQRFYEISTILTTCSCSLFVIFMEMRLFDDIITVYSVKPFFLTPYFFNKTPFKYMYFISINLENKWKKFQWYMYNHFNNNFPIF